MSSVGPLPPAKARVRRDPRRLRPAPGRGAADRGPRAGVLRRRGAARHAAPPDRLGQRPRQARLRPPARQPRAARHAAGQRPGAGAVPRAAGLDHGLGTGGDAITLSWRLVGAGADSPAACPRVGRRRSAAGRAAAGRRPRVQLLGPPLPAPRVAVDAGGADPDRDVRLCVLPPSQMPLHMAGGYLDGFCAGEPWNTLSAFQGSGKVVAVTTDIVPNHPDKVLAVRSRWLAAHADVAAALVRAVLRGCRVLRRPGPVPASWPRCWPSRSTSACPPTRCSRACPASACSARGGRAVPVLCPADHVPQHDPRGLAGEADGALGPRAAGDGRGGRRPPVGGDGAVPQGGGRGGVDCPADDAPPMRLRDGWFELESLRSDQHAVRRVTG